MGTSPQYDRRSDKGEGPLPDRVSKDDIVLPGREAFEGRTMSFRDLGFEVWQTGGNCKAWGKTLPDKSYVMVTDEGGADLPEDVAVDPDGNVVARNEDFNPALDSTGRFKVPEGHWTFSKVLVGYYDPDGELKGTDTFDTVTQAINVLSERASSRVEPMEEVNIDILDVDYEWFRDVRAFTDSGRDRFYLPRESAERLGELDKESGGFHLLDGRVTASPDEIEVNGGPLPVWVVNASEIRTRPTIRGS